MRKELLELIKKEAFFKKQVRLSSGKMSNYYIDVRRVSLSPQGVYLISHLVWDMVKNEGVTAIGGPTLGADPIVSGVCMAAYEAKKDFKGFLVRKTPKEYGQRRMIEGCELASEDKVVLVDDVATSGSSLIKAVEVLKREKIKVVKAIVVIDREEGAQENFAKINIPLVSLFTKTALF